MEPLGRRRDVAKLPARGVRGLVGVHAVGNQSIGFVGDVGADFFGEIGQQSVGASAW